MRARRLGIHTGTVGVAWVGDPRVASAERVEIATNGRSVLLMALPVETELLAADEIGFSEAAWETLSAAEGQEMLVRPSGSGTPLRARLELWSC